MEKIKWPEKVSDERIGKTRALLNNILGRKVNWIGCILRDAVEGQLMNVKGVGRRRTQVLDYLRNRRY